MHNDKNKVVHLHRLYMCGRTYGVRCWLVAFRPHLPLRFSQPLHMKSIYIRIPHTKSSSPSKQIEVERPQKVIVLRK
jgi:hypothetical protein